MRRFPHAGPAIIFLLYFSITAPYAIIYIYMNNSLTYNTSLQQTAYLYFGIDGYFKDNRMHIKNEKEFSKVYK